MASRIKAFETYIYPASEAVSVLSGSSVESIVRKFKEIVLLKYAGGEKT